MKASLIILGQRHDTALINTLRCAMAQRYASLDIIITDIRAKRGPAAQDFLERMQHRVHYVEMAHHSLAQARNAGARAAGGDVLIYIDDHVSFEQDLVEQHMACYLDERIGAVQGRVLGGNGQSDQAPGLSRWGSCTGSIGWAHSAQVERLGGQHFSVRRSLYVDAGRFDERFTHNDDWCDIEFGMRCRRLLSLRFAADIVVLNHVKPVAQAEQSIHILSLPYRQGEALFVALHVEGWAARRWQHARRFWHDIQATRVLRRKAARYAAFDARQKSDLHDRPIEPLLTSM